MNDEEKKAIELLKNKRPSELFLVSGKIASQMLFSLIEKQQKEIEKYHKLKKDLVKVNKKIYDVETIDKLIDENANSTPNQDIRDLIEELESTLDLCKGDGKVAKYKIKALEEEIRDLNELLGE